MLFKLCVYNIAMIQKIAVLKSLSYFPGLSRFLARSRTDLENIQSKRLLVTITAVNMREDFIILPQKLGHFL